MAIVLGGIKGIGKAIAINLAQSGVNIATTWFDWEENVEQLKADLSNTGTDHIIKKINLLKTEKIPEFIHKVIKKFGRLDILINNIERGGWPIVHGPYTKDQWDMEIATTLRTKQWFLRYSLPYLKASRDASVINFSSIAGIVGRSGPTSLLFNEGYSSANRGVSLLTETWARLGAPEVRVNEIMLGIFETRHGPKTKGWGLLRDNHKKAIINRTLMGRTGKTNDIITTVRFLIQDASFITGSTIKLDGGYTLL